MKLKESPEDFIVNEIPSFSLTPQGKFFIHKMKKRLWNTENAVQEISKKLKIHRKKIGYSGNKDKIAVTTQYISLPLKAEGLAIKDIELKFVGNSNSQISLGDHLGNEFEIIARECETAPIEKHLILNLYGEQRFSTNNAAVGKALVKKDFKTACEILELEVKGNDYLAAIKKVPMRLATLYIHAYQSLLWNTVAESVETEALPLLGFGSDLIGEVKEAYEKIMKEEGITQRDFINRQWPALSAEGDIRKRTVSLDNLEIEKIDEKTYRIKFFLPKGCYATNALSQLFP